MRADDLPAGVVAVVGLPHDVTKISRAGAAEGPRAIRRATLMFEFAVREMAAGAVVDIDTGRGFFHSPGAIADLGDVELGSDPAENARAIESAIEAIVVRHALPLVLGGDHFVTYPVVTGLSAQIDMPVAYLHIDMHLDLADDVPGFGKLASGTPLRRLIEREILDPSRVVIFGAESFQHRNEWEFARDSGIDLISAAAVHRDGVGATLIPALERITEGGRGLYVSTDIDVLSRTYAPGTGNAVGVTGLDPGQLLEVARIVRERRLVGLDLVEVSPRWDPTERTAGIAAAYLLEILWPTMFTESPL